MKNCGGVLDVNSFCFCLMFLFRRGQSRRNSPEEKDKRKTCQLSTLTSKELHGNSTVITW